MALRSRSFRLALLLGAMVLGIAQVIAWYGAEHRRKLTRALLRQIAGGNPDPAGVEQLLRQGADPNAGAPGGPPILLMAIQNGDTATAQVLVERGARVNVRNDSGTPLHWACRSAAPALVRSLIRHGADMHAADASGETPLLQAARAGDAGSVEALLNAGARPDQADREGRTPLMFGREGSDVDQAAVVRQLLAHGADVNAVDRSGGTPLMQHAGDPDSLSILLAHGAKVDQKDSQGMTALMFAAAHGSAESVRRLLRRGARVNPRDRRGWTALRHAVEGISRSMAPTTNRPWNPDPRVFLFDLEQYRKWGLPHAEAALLLRKAGGTL